MSNILHKVADKLSGDDNHDHDQRVDEQGNRLTSQQQSHGRQSDMGYMDQTQSGMGKDSQRSGNYDDEGLGARQTRSKNKMTSRNKDHYDEFDDDFNDSANMSGGRSTFNKESEFQSSRGSGQQQGLGSQGMGMGSQGMGNQGLSGQSGGRTHVPGTDKDAEAVDYTNYMKNTGRGPQGSQNNQFSNDNW